MALSRTKKEKSVKARRLKKVRKLYPSYPFGVLDASREAELQQFIRTGQTGYYFPNLKD